MGINFMIYVVATIHIHPEHRAEFLENARVVIAATVKEQGCLHYDLHSSITEPNCFVFVERWENRDALQGHFESAHMAEWRRVGGPLIEKRTVEIIHPDKVETL
jgi:quinol monooxygenase YgiN